jgi:hypothetical protein
MPNNISKNPRVYSGSIKPDELPLTTREQFEQKTAYCIRQHRHAQQVSDALHATDGNDHLKAVATANVWITEQTMNYIVGEFKAFVAREGSR